MQSNMIFDDHEDMRALPVKQEDVKQQQSYDHKQQVVYAPAGKQFAEDEQHYEDDFINHQEEEDVQIVHDKQYQMSGK